MTPDEMADQFLDKFDDYLSGEQKNLSAYSIDQVRTLINLIQSDPFGMTEYLCITAEVVDQKAKDRYHGEPEYVANAMKQFNMVMITLLVPSLGFTLQETSRMIGRSLEYTHVETKNKGANAINTDPQELFKNLDFKLPDWDSIPPDQ